MAHIEKYKGVNSYNLINHDNRTKLYYKENVDKEKSHMNYNICSIDNEIERLNELIKMAKESGAQIREDTNTIISVIVTLPKDFPNNETLKRAFFEGCYDFIAKDFKEENIISAWVHNDESQPHIHIKFCPIREKLKKYKNGSEKTIYSFDAKNCVNLNYLKTFHNRLEEHLTDFIGFKPTILNGATKDGHKTIEELKKTSEQQKKDRELINKDAWLIIAEQKKILNDYWEEYKRISQKYWADYKLQKNIISNSIYELKKDIKGTERDLKRSLDFVGNLSYGLFYALSRLVCAFCMYYRVNTLQNELKTIESNLGALEDVRRTVSNHQHNTKEKLKNNDLISIEEALENWERSAFGINAKIRDNMRKRENEIQIPEREEIEL